MVTTSVTMRNRAGTRNGAVLEESDESGIESDVSSFVVRDQNGVRKDQEWCPVK